MNVTAHRHARSPHAKCASAYPGKSLHNLGSAVAAPGAVGPGTRRVFLARIWAMGRLHTYGLLPSPRGSRGSGPEAR